VDNTYALAFYNLGVVLSEGGRHEDALGCYTSTTRLNPNHAEALCNIGRFGYHSSQRYFVVKTRFN
jgi:tetratricopeptide (TPR) repeat protein